MNMVMIQGNLARDPVIRSTKNGKAVARFTIAANTDFISPQGERKQRTDWVNVIAWGNWAELVANTCHKGTGVFVSGRYTTGSYDDPKTNQRVWTTEVTADFVAPSPRDTQENQQGYGGQQNQQGGQSRQGFGQFGEVYPMTQEEIPF